jgi:hypothetical protein
MKLRILSPHPESPYFLELFSVGKLDPGKHYEDFIEVIGKIDT